MTTILVNPSPVSQCRKPSGWLGRFIVWNMNSRHSKVTDWGLSHISVKAEDTVLDVGCGGGRTVAKLAASASKGRVFGIDYSDVCVSMARKLNARQIEQGQVEIHEASVLQLPFAADTFDIVTAVETHFWWPDLPAGMREILRVLKPGGTLLVVAEIYANSESKIGKLADKVVSISGMKLLSVDEHRSLLSEAGYSNVQISTQPRRGWICATGKKPST